MLVCIRRGPASLPNINGRASCRWIFIYLTRSLQASYCTPSTPHIFPPPWLLFLHRTPKRFPIYWWLRISFAGLPSVLSEGSPVPQRPCSLPSQHFILLSDGNIPCGNVNLELPAQGSLLFLFLCCSALSHLMALATSPRRGFFMITSCDLSTSPRVPVAPALLWFPFSCCLQRALGSAPASLRAGG